MALPLAYSIAVKIGTLIDQDLDDMRIGNPFRLNDWSIEKFICLVLAVQAAALLVLLVDSADSKLLLLRQIICFVYLTFVPGVLLLRVLKLHNLGSVLTTAYSVGLSLTTLMVTGACLNIFLPLAGIVQPITLPPLILSLTAIVLVLCVVGYIRDREYYGDATFEADPGLLSAALLLLLIPFMAIFGTYIINHTDNNLMLVALILILALIVLVIGFTRIIPKELYPLVVFVIALSLLLHNSLISSSLIGWDIHQEKYLADEVIASGAWDVTLSHNVNSMLSIMMLAPIYSIFLGVDVTWVYKVVFPLLFALLPVALFQAYRSQSDDKIAFLSAFAFTSLVVFFTEMLQLARQEIAELFLGLILLLLVDRSMEKKKWTALFILFTFSLVLSHYGLTLIFIGMIALAWGLLYVISRLRKESLHDLNRRLSPLLVLCFVVFCGAWYINTASADPFRTAVSATDDIVSPVAAIAIDLLTPDATPSANSGAANATGGAAIAGQIDAGPKPVATQPMELITTGGQSSVLHTNYLYLLLATQALIVIGILSVMFVKSPVKISREFYVLAFIGVMLLALALVLPKFAVSLNTTRLYQIMMIFLAPFVVVGWMALFRLPGLLAKRDFVPVALKLFAVLMVVYLVFNTGLIFELFKDVPMSYSLNKKGENISYTIYNSMEVQGAVWLLHSRAAMIGASNISYIPPIFSDTNNRLLLTDWNASRSYEMPTNASKIPLGSYIFLGTYNVMNDKGMAIIWKGETQNQVKISLVNLEDTRNKIYASGGSEVYL